MKKSWHPLLMKNQERVWLEEKKALEERKKLDQLKKEKEEERQLQELQRMQEEQTGRKRAEKLEWMYATPATGSGANSNDLEDYLLGKKRVDKLLVGDENQALGASHKNFIAIQHANTIRDTAAKVREDPLFMIKQQEQAALQALRENPLRLKEMQERNGLVTKPPRKEKERKKHRDKSPSRRKRRHSDSRSRSPHHRSREHRREEGSASYRHSRRSRSPVTRHSRSERDHTSYQSRFERDHDSYRARRDARPLSLSRSPRSARLTTSNKEGTQDRSRSPIRTTTTRSTSTTPPNSRHERPPLAASETVTSRADKLAAMLSNASEVNDERRQRLTTRLAEERAEMELENKLRAKSEGSSAFISDQQKRVFGGLEGGLGEYMRRGKMGMVVERD